MNPYLEKIKGFGAPRRWGSTERKPVIHEDTGKEAGYHTEHWDDHVDAVVTPQIPRIKLKRGAQDA